MTKNSKERGRLDTSLHVEARHETWYLSRECDENREVLCMDGSVKCSLSRESDVE